MGVLLDLNTRRSPFSAVAGLLLFLILCFIPPEGVSTFALDLGRPKYRLQARQNPDRKEGLKSFEIAGEKLSLLSVFLNVPDIPRKEPGNTYRLGFFLRQAEHRVNIKVRDYQMFNKEKYHYWMLPTRKRYDRGFREFTWDAALARELGIGLQDVGAVAWVRGYGYPMVAPLLLHAAPFPSRMQVHGCRFMFIPNETMTVEYRLYPKGQESRVFLHSLAEKWDKDQKQTIDWGGRDSQSNPAPEGMYVLRLTAKVASALGKPPKRIPYDYVFYYKPEIATQR